MRPRTMRLEISQQMGAGMYLAVLALIFNSMMARFDSDGRYFAMAALGVTVAVILISGGAVLFVLDIIRWRRGR